MKKCKEKKSKGSVLAGAVSIGLILGMLTGCSALAPASSEMQIKYSTENTGDIYQKHESTLTESVDDEENLESQSNDFESLSESPEETDRQEIQEIAEKFAAAYFSGDTEVVQSCLTTPYEWKREDYMSTGTISDFMLRGLADIGEEEIGSIKVVSIEYKNSADEDKVQYLTLEFVKQEEGWKIQFYGIEP